MIAITFTPGYMYLASKNLDVNCCALFVGIFVGMLKLLTQCSRNSVATVVVDIFAFGIAFVSFDKQFCITTKY